MLSDQAIQNALMQNGVRDGTNGAAVVGGGGDTKAVFYMHATLDGDATQAAGRKIYREAPYIKLWADGCTESASHIAKDVDRRAYPQEWATFEQNRSKPQHSVTHLPGFSAVHFRYCEDAEIFTIEALVATDVQPELKELQETAKRWLSLLRPEATPKTKGWPKGKPRGKKVKPDGLVA
jgi:hypothetical protein